MEEYFFEENLAVLLERDGFLTSMWDEFDAM